MRSLKGTSDLSLSHLGSVWWKDSVCFHVQIFSPRRPSPPSPVISLDSFLPSAICLESFKWFFLWNCSLLSLIWIPILSNPIQSNLSRLFLQRETEGRRGRGSGGEIEGKECLWRTMTIRWLSLSNLYFLPFNFSLFLSFSFPLSPSFSQLYKAMYL